MRGIGPREALWSAATRRRFGTARACSRFSAPAGGGGAREEGGGEETPPGEVGFYRVERRKRTLAGQQTEDWGFWQVTTTDTEITLLDLERGVEHDFRIVAVNAAGDSIPSNVVTVVL